MVKKALCCGLNYPNQKKYQLFGCINDCLDWEHLLKNTFQFDETRVLIDQNPDGTLCTAPTQIPTRANILAQLGGWLCAGNEPGDCLVFVFAGHGCQVRSGYGQVDEALVPEDFDTPDEQGMSPLVMDDELHALFARLPAGSFLTVVLDCCHAAHMLDVSCSMDSSHRPPKTLQVCERPREVHNRTDDAWQKALISHAMARPRFVPTITSNGVPRQRRTPEGAGAHVGRMTLDPGVTAFCFAASRTQETALDANIKAHQRGVMSFCLIEALAALRNRCTYEMLLEKASAKMDDIREKYMPTMDQYIQLSFCPNSAPSEVVVLDERYARVAQHRLTQRARLAERGQSGDGLRSSDGCPTPVREVSTEFVPSPAYNQPDRGPPAGQSLGGLPGGPPDHGYRPPELGQRPPEPGHRPPEPGRGGHPGHFGTATLYLVIHAGYNLLYRDAGHRGDGCEPYVVARVGHQEHKTPSISSSLNPVWSEGNHLTFHVGERDGLLELEVMNGYSSLGRTGVDLRALQPGQWHRRREALREGGGGELEFDLRLEPVQERHERQERHDRSERHERPDRLERQEWSDPGRGYPDQSHGGSVGGVMDGTLSNGGYGLGAGSMQPPAQPQQQHPPPQQHPPLQQHLPPQQPLQPSQQQPPPALPECGGNLFGTPNLFGAMPNLMSNVFGAPGGPPPSLPGTLGNPAASQWPLQEALAMPGRTPSNQLPAPSSQLGVTYPAPAGAGPSGQAARAGAGVPNATIGIDINLNGRTDLVISGPDLNRDGIPDILQQAQGPACGAPACGAPAFGAAPPGRPSQPVYGAGPGQLPGGAYAPPPAVRGPSMSSLGSTPLGAYPCPYPRGSRLY